MADWYVSSAAYAAVPVFAASTAYTVGQFVRATAPASGREYVHRCTTAGTTAGSEPAWNGNNNGTTTSGGATFTNVSGQSTYGWSAAAGTLYSFANANFVRPAVGDRVFLSSDHTETFAAATVYAFGSNAFGLIQFISVSRAGSVPPVAADIASGAGIGSSAGVNLTLDTISNVYWQGITITLGGTASIPLQLVSTGAKQHWFKNCAFVLSNNNAGTRITIADPVKVTFDNTTLQFGHASQGISSGAWSFDFTWLNTASAIAGATIPTTLFNATASSNVLFTARGVDLSALTGTLVGIGSTTTTKVLLDSCKIASGLTRLATPSTSQPLNDEVELVNCYNGTSIINERYTQAGNVTTDRSTTLSGGAQDDSGAYSLKLVSNARSDFCTMALDCFWLDVENTATGASKTATVEIISSASLNNNDIRLLLEYMGTGGSPVASFGDSLATVLTPAAALPSSAVTWNNPPGTPVKQYLQVTFTPQAAGRVRGLVRLGKVSTTVWVNPSITIS